MLLVDDDDNIRTVAMIALEDEPGWEIFEARSGMEALAIAKAQKPDLILLDMMMPGMDGKETLHRLREDEEMAQTPVIFVTAKVQTHEIEGYKQLGAMGVITKPFDPLTLITDIIEILAGKEAMDV